MPLMSVIVPTHGRVSLFEETIECLAKQTCKLFEVIVTDDSPVEADQENIKILVEKYKSQGLDVRYIFSKPNLFQALNTNQGIKAAKGEYIRILHSDDLLSKDCIDIEVNILDANPDIDFGYHHQINFKNKISFKNNNITDYKMGKDIKEIDIYHHWLKGQIFVSTVIPTFLFFRKSLLEKVGGMEEDYHFLCDWKLFFAFLINSYQERKNCACVIGCGFVGWRVHSDSVTETLYFEHYTEHEDFINKIVETYKKDDIVTPKEIKKYTQSAYKYRCNRLSKSFSKLPFNIKKEKFSTYLKIVFTSRYYVLHQLLKLLLLPFKLIGKIGKFILSLFLSPIHTQDKIEQKMYKFWVK